MVALTARPLRGEKLYLNHRLINTIQRAQGPGTQDYPLMELHPENQTVMLIWPLRALLMQRRLQGSRWPLIARHQKELLQTVRLRVMHKDQRIRHPPTRKLSASSQSNLEGRTSQFRILKHLKMVWLTQLEIIAEAVTLLVQNWVHQPRSLALLAMASVFKP